MEGVVLILEAHRKMVLKVQSQKQLGFYWFYLPYLFYVNSLFGFLPSRGFFFLKEICMRVADYVWYMVALLYK